MESISELFAASPKSFVRNLIFVLIGVAAVAEFFISRAKRKRVHEPTDLWVNLGMYLGYLPIYAGIIYVLMPFMQDFWSRYALMPTGRFWWRADGMSLLEWVALFLLVDLAYYFYHYCCHHSRFLWASHVGHHSSRHFNITTGVRQPWVPLFPFFFWLPIVWIGFHPAIVVLVAAINLNFQILLHTQFVRSFGPLDWILNSPSHHRVHHASNPEYRDKNLGGILIVWDRLMGTFARESEAPVYGIGDGKDHHNFVENSFGEFARLFSNLKGIKGAARKIGYVFGPPKATDNPEPAA